MLDVLSVVGIAEFGSPMQYVFDNRLLSSPHNDFSNGSRMILPMPLSQV